MAYAVDDQIANSGFGNVPLTRLENRAFGLMKVCRNAAVKAHNDGLYVDAYRFMEKCALIQENWPSQKETCPLERRLNVQIVVLLIKANLNKLLNFITN